MIVESTIPPVMHPLLMDRARALGLSRRIVEIGPGRGDFLFHLARQHPDAEVIGIEIKIKRFRKLQHRRGDLSNVTLILGDAREALPEIARSGPVEHLYINFPDPWPKRRHAKNRLMQTPFIRIVAETLAPEGQLSFTTDVAAYAHETAHRIGQTCPTLRSTDDCAVRESEQHSFPTFFAQKWQRAGRTIYQQEYRRSDRQLQTRDQ